MKSSQVGLGEIKTNKEKSKGEAKKLNRKLPQAKETCIKQCLTKEECENMFPPYSGYKKCGLCKRGGKL